MHSSGVFRIKPIARLILKREILGSHMISDQSLLLSTIVLNDYLNLMAVIDDDTCHMSINNMNSKCHTKKNPTGYT